MSIEEAIGALQYGIVLLGSAFAGVSSFRRHCVRRVLKHDFAEICDVSEQYKDPKPITFSFDDFSFKIKKVLEENKLFNQVSCDHEASRPEKSLKSSAESNSFKPFHRNTGGFSTRTVVFRKKQWKN